jgi:hypothetical protein
MGDKPTPTRKTTKGNGEPKAPQRGKPYLSQGGGHATYLGRVIIEVWDDAGYGDPSWGLSYTYDLAPTGVSGKELLDRVASNFSERLQKDKPLMADDAL